MVWSSRYRHCSLVRSNQRSADSPTRFAHTVYRACEQCVDAIFLCRLFFNCSHGEPIKHRVNDECSERDLRLVSEICSTESERGHMMVEIVDWLPRASSAYAVCCGLSDVPACIRPRERDERMAVFAASLAHVFQRAVSALRCRHSLGCSQCPHNSHSQISMPLTAEGQGCLPFVRRSIRLRYRLT